VGDENGIEGGTVDPHHPHVCQTYIDCIII
jgi:hypothetical protein